MNFWNKILIKRLIKLTPLYFRMRSSFKNEDEIQEAGEYFAHAKKIINTIPFYKNSEVYHKENLNKITEFPLLEKSQIIGKETDFLSEKINRKFLFNVSTGGTSGKSLNFYKTIKEVIKEEAFISYSFSLIGKNLKIGILRGNRLSKGFYKYKYGHLLLSSYNLSLDNVRIYVELIKKYNINCLHVYPTSIHIFLSYLKELKGSIELPDLKGILSSSEILSKEDKSLIFELFPTITLIDLYGQNEHVAFALSINQGFYKFYKNYSFVEFIPVETTLGNNTIAEIVGTNVFNQAMPLIRYRTEDFVEIDGNGNIYSIIGRTQDFIVNKNNNIIPCIVSTRDNSLRNVLSFQYYQEKEGELIYRVLVNDNFSKDDEREIIKDLSDCFNGLVDVKIKIVTEIEKTSTGKQIRAIQKLDIKKYL